MLLSGFHVAGDQEGISYHPFKELPPANTNPAGSTIACCANHHSSLLSCPNERVRAAVHQAPTPIQNIKSLYCNWTRQETQGAKHIVNEHAYPSLGIYLWSIKHLNICVSPLAVSKPYNDLSVFLSNNLKSK